MTKKKKYIKKVEYYWREDGELFNETLTIKSNSFKQILIQPLFFFVLFILSIFFIITFPFNMKRKTYWEEDV